MKFDKLVDNYRHTIEDLFIDAELKDRYTSHYESFCTIYESMFASELETLFFNDVLEDIERCINSIKTLFIDFFSGNAQKDAVVSKEVIRQIVEHGMEEPKDGVLKIGCDNPMILESLLVCHYQKKDYLEHYKSFKQIYDNTSLTHLDVLNRQLYIGKVDRLFRDIVVLYQGEFYKIYDVEYDNKNDVISNVIFLARKEDSFSSIEMISATRLLEKIISDFEVNKAHKILIVGEVLSYIDNNGCCRSTFDDLMDMLKLRGYNNLDVTLFNKNNDEKRFLSVFSPKGIDDCINSYDKVFILDCPKIYHEICLNELADNARVINSAQPDFPALLDDAFTGEKDFFNKNGFATLYYRVQNYLLDISKNNSRKTRNVNIELLNHIKRRMSDSNERLCREFYVYLSNDSDFKNELYDKYNFVRLERYNSKDCRIIKYPEPGTVRGEMVISRQMNTSITWYKLLKMISPDNKFHKYFTALDETYKKFVDCYDIARKIKIKIEYSPLKLVGKKRTMDLRIYVTYANDLNKNTSVVESLRERVRVLIKEMFNFDRSIAIGQVTNNILAYCYKKAVANVISGCAENLNDCMYHHFYMQKIMRHYKNFGDRCVEFKIKEYAENETDEKDTFEKLDNMKMQYSLKRIAYSMMEELDSKYCDGEEIINQRVGARINKESINMYVIGLLNSCENFGYDDSILYNRLERRF